MRRVLMLLVVTFILLSLAAADMPASFYQAMGNMKNQDILCVKNYQAGASFTEAYTDFESLDKDTQVVSRAPKYQTNYNAALEANINSKVIGNARLAWQSVSPIPSAKGRHVIFSRNGDTLTGAFTIQKFLQLWSNSTILESRLNWLPCS